MKIGIMDPCPNFREMYTFCFTSSESATRARDREALIEKSLFTNFISSITTSFYYGKSHAATVDCVSRVAVRRRGIEEDPNLHGVLESTGAVTASLRSQASGNPEFWFLFWIALFATA
ncbi:MAG: hypothetical protein LBJ71_03495 [Holosporaceae bacterium]|jgi:hypothetical protein|nr:hypothetical protein [Holosporaceae bacterium]